jgi:predicted RNase H-like HicB family nuclease
MSRYLIILEKTPSGFSAYSPDLPGCVAAGQTREQVEREMREAIEFHIEGLRLAGETILNRVHRRHTAKWPPNVAELFIERFVRYNLNACHNKQCVSVLSAAA